MKNKLLDRIKNRQKKFEEPVEPAETAEEKQEKATALAERRAAFNEKMANRRNKRKAKEQAKKSDNYVALLPAVEFRLALIKKADGYGYIDSELTEAQLVSFVESSFSAINLLLNLSLIPEAYDPKYRDLIIQYAAAQALASNSVPGDSLYTKYTNEMENWMSKIEIIVANDK